MFLISLRTTLPGDMPTMPGVLSDDHAKNLLFYVKRDFEAEELDTVEVQIVNVKHVDYDAAEAKVDALRNAQTTNYYYLPQY